MWSAGPCCWTSCDAWILEWLRAHRIPWFHNSFSILATKVRWIHEKMDRCFFSISGPWDSLNRNFRFLEVRFHRVYCIVCTYISKVYIIIDYKPVHRSDMYTHSPSLSSHVFFEASSIQLLGEWRAFVGSTSLCHGATKAASNRSKPDETWAKKSGQDL